MLYYSTNHISDKVTFREAMLRSEAPDGGLYMPERLPVVPSAFINNMSDMSLSDLSYVITNMFFGRDLPSSQLKRIGEEALSFPVPLVEIEPGIYVMELFHGPTHTVKDIGARFLGAVLHELRDSDNPGELNVLISTNGNSGNAVANVFHNRPGVNVFALYPRDLQQPQISTLNAYGDNIHTIEVNGHLDVCANLVHRVSLDREMQPMSFTAANSFNIGHLLPYTIVYFSAMAQLNKRKWNIGDVYFSIPTGSAGNLCAAYMACKMGLKVNGLIAACNHNSGFPGLLERGVECHSEIVERSLAYSMDTPRTINMSRMLELCDGDLAQLRRMVVADKCDDAEITAAIADVKQRTGYVLDPHSAVAYASLKKQMPSGATGVFFATAAPQTQYAAAVRASTSIPPTYGALKKCLRSKVGRL